ncbi:hypothetical protein HYH02_009815 [Chlamydomonas schloesseri]|uniref:Protein kinase domain-containing protein n=1 Tax=Chlamydomonas schloesseri TaxID=2026947 RepID=A0A835TEQ5_9CHLO|nr:hypothetical protein HYH02_009815 [Chlamydomonas schloesseri]|eukprot:KAG2442023.1 hypothetical protein HYH02_009815 [Chlamydomonas schloesseri]
MAAKGFDEDPLAGSVLRTVRVLGSSADNTVVLASNSFTGQLVAVKLISRGFDSPRAKYLLRELLNHYELTLAKHPHIVSLLDVFLTPRHLAIVMEYVDGENLQAGRSGVLGLRGNGGAALAPVFTEKAGGCIIEPLARFLFQQLVIALDFCHRRGKVNRGIRPASLLLQLSASALPLLKLSDFSLSKDTLRHSEPRSQVGTAMFCAPEVLQNFKGAPYDAAAVDVWGIGVVLFMMLYGRHPFSRPEDASLNAAQQVVAMFKRVTAPPGSPEGDLLIPPQLPTSVLAGAPPGAPLSTAAADLLRGLLARDPRARLSLDGVQQHEWFRTGLPEGAALLNDVVAAEEQAAGSAAVMQPTVAAQLERMVVAAAAGPVAAPQQQLSGGGGGAGGGAATAHGESTDGPASSSAQTGLSSLTEATLGGGTNGAYLSASPASGALPQHPQPTPAPAVPGWTVTTSGTSDAAVASVSIGSTVPGRPGPATSHSTAVPQLQQQQHHHHQPPSPLLMQSAGGLVSMMADLATPMPWSPLEAGSGAGGAGGSTGGTGGGGGGGGGAGGGDLLDDLEALVMGLPEDEVDMSAASLDFLIGASQQQQHTQAPLAPIQPQTAAQQQPHTQHMPHGPSPLNPHAQQNPHPHQAFPHAQQHQYMQRTSPQALDHAMGANASAPSSADASALGAAAVAGTAASPPHPAAGPGAAMAPGPPRIVSPPALFTSLHAAAATAVDATAGLLSRLRTDSLPSPSTLAVVDAQPFLLGGGGSGSVRHGGGGAGGGGSGSGGSGASLINRGGSLAWLHNDGSIVTIPSTYSMDWCTLSARSQTLLSAPDLAMLQAGSGTGAAAAVAGPGAAPGGAATAPPAGAAGVDTPDAGTGTGTGGGGGSNSPALVQGSVWHRICNDAKGALKGVATEARGLGRAAAAAAAGLGSTAGVITTGAAAQRSKGR